MSQPADSEADESRTRYFGTKRDLAAAEGENSGASTPNKRSRRGRRGPQDHRDFVPMGGSFSNSAQIVTAASLDADNLSDSSASSPYNPESYGTRSTDLEGSTNGPHTTRPRVSEEHFTLGQNRLITGFTKVHSQPGTTTKGGTSEVPRNGPTSHHSFGESADDAIEISDDTDMDEASEDGGMMINVDNEVEKTAIPNTTQPMRRNTRQFRILGWARRTPASKPHVLHPGISSDAKLDADVKPFCEFLERRSTPKHLPNLQILDADRDGESLIISVRHEDAKAFANLNGRKIAGRNITIQEISSGTSADISDGEIDEGLTFVEDRTACPRSHSGKTNHESRECPQESSQPALPAVADQVSNDDAHEKSQDDLKRSPSSNSTTTPMTRPGAPPQRLGDLSADAFEDQVRYTLFHLKRDQIDLNRPASCTTCLQQGHEETSCPESNCIHCGVKDEHPSCMCPTYRRCLRCRQRGHDVGNCISKLKDNTVPCDHCGVEGHLEDSCPLRFFPSQSQSSTTDLKLWISCCFCASKTHLVGDCPERRASSQAAAWSLRSLNPMQIHNLSLESGTRKTERDAEIRGTKQESLTIKGRADQHRQGQGNDTPSWQAQVERRGESPRIRDQNRFEGRDFERNRRRGGRGQEVRDDLYRPSSDFRAQGALYERYESSYTDYRDQPSNRRDKFYATDSFGRQRRSRSPESRSFRAAKAHRRLQPPLPKEPIPNRPPPAPPHQRDSAPASSNLPARSRTVDRGPPGVDSYRPMPSAAKKAWNKHRL